MYSHDVHRSSTDQIHRLPPRFGDHYVLGHIAIELCYGIRPSGNVDFPYSGICRTSEGGYQIQQAKIAIAKGGWFGLGPGNGMQRNHLPSPYADYIYAMIMEEFGIIGAFFIMLLYIWLFMRSVRIVTRSPKAFGALLAVGLSIILMIQALANMAVSVDLVPVTGLALPMISMGGTSLIFTCISFGIILSVSKYIKGNWRIKNSLKTAVQIISQKYIISGGKVRGHVPGNRHRKRFESG